MSTTPNEKIPATEQSNVNLTKSMDPTKNSPSEDIQWITEPASDDGSLSAKKATDEVVEKVPAESEHHEEPSQFNSQAADEPSQSSSQVVEELEKKVQAVELANDEEDEFVRSPLQTEKDENGFMFYKCRFCGLTFNFITTLKAHERVHDVETPYLCNKCGECFHFMCELEFHAKTHQKQKGYKCDCGRTFYQYTDLLYHHHPGEDPEPLPLPQPQPRERAFSKLVIDPAEFPTPGFAEQGFEPKHPMRIYSEVRSKPYICQYCSKSYSDSRQLAYHMYSHRGERTFNPRASRYLMARNENSYITPGADVKTPFV